MNNLYFLNRIKVRVSISILQFTMSVTPVQFCLQVMCTSNTFLPWYVVKTFNVWYIRKNIPIRISTQDSCFNFCMINSNTLVTLLAHVISDKCQMFLCLHSYFEISIYQLADFSCHLASLVIFVLLFTWSNKKMKRRKK